MLLLVMSAFALLSAGTASAQIGIGASGTNLDTVAGKAGTKEENLGIVVGTIVNALLSLVGLIFLILMVYAGILWMTARGEEDQISKAQKIITASLIGLFITVSAYAITVFVTGKFQG